jgi:hypothetical protein
VLDWLGHADLVGSAGKLGVSPARGTGSRAGVPTP